MQSADLGHEASTEAYQVSNYWKTFMFNVIIVFSKHNGTVIDCSTGLLIARLQQSIKQLTDENEEQNKALEEAKTELKELREFMNLVSIRATRLLTGYVICYNLNPDYQCLQNERDSCTSWI